MRQKERGDSALVSPDLASAHRGYAHQDAVSAFLLADGLVTGNETTIDSKLHSADLFDDVGTRGKTGLTRRQLKFGAADRVLTLEDLNTQKSDARLDDLIRSFKGDHGGVSEYRVCVTWKVDQTDPIMEFLTPSEVESTFRPHRTKPFRLRPEIIWPISQAPLWSSLRKASDIDREDFVRFCAIFVLEADCPTASLNLQAPGPLEALLFDKMNREVGIGRYPNDHIEPLEAVASLILLATRARTEHLTIRPKTVISTLRLRTDYGRVAQRFPVNESVRINTETLLDDLQTAAGRSNRLVVTGEPGSGKSWALTQLANRLEADGAVVTRHYCYLEPGDRDVQRRILRNALFGNLIAELASKHTELSSVIRPRFSAGSEELEDLLKQLHKEFPEKRIYLIVDGLDHIARVHADNPQIALEEIDIVERLALLPVLKSVCLIVGSQPGRHLDRLSDAAEAIELPGWLPQNVIELSKRLGVDSAIRDAGFGDTIEEFQQELIVRSEGNPLYTTLICRKIGTELLEGRLEKDPVTAIREIPTHEGDLGRYYRYLMAGEISAAASEVSDVLSVIDFSVSETELKEILPASAHRVADVVRKLSPILERVAMQGGIRIYHESFKRFSLHELQKQKASVRAVLAPVVEWLYKRDFFADSKAYRFLFSCLRRSDRSQEMFELCDVGFITKSVAAGHAPDAVTQNLLMVIDSASRLREWPVITRVSELQRSLATFVSEGLDPERFGRTFEALRGAGALNERLLFEGRPTHSRDVGLVLCSLCDDANQSPPWYEYLAIMEDPKNSTHHDPTLDLAGFHGMLRTLGPDVGVDALADYLKSGTTSIDNAAPYIHRLGKTAGINYLEKLAKVSDLPQPARWLVSVQTSLLAASLGQLELSTTIATSVLQEQPDVETALACINLGAPASLYDASSISLEAYEIGIGGKRYFDNERVVSQWVAAVGILAFTDEKKLLDERRRLDGAGWYRCWLRYVIGLSIAQARRSMQPQLLDELMLSAFSELQSDLAPFTGTPRACDLYRIHGLIQRTFETGLRLVSSASVADWNVVLNILYDVSVGTTTFLQNDAGGPLQAEILYELFAPYARIKEFTQPILKLFEKRFTRSVDARGIYNGYASQELLLTNVFVSVRDQEKAEHYWQQACLHMCAYGQRKDITIYELLDSVECLSESSEAKRAIKDLQPLVDAVVDHTDGKSTSGTPVAWFKQFYAIDPISAGYVLCKSLIRRYGVYDWRLESAARHVLESEAGEANPLILLFLCFASPPGEERIAFQSSYRIFERAVQLHPKEASNFARAFFASVQDDSHDDQTEIQDKTRLLLENIGIYVPVSKVGFAKTATTQRTQTLNERIGLTPRDARGPFELPTSRSSFEVMKAISSLDTQTLESIPDRNRLVNYIGYWMLEMAQEGRHSEATAFLTFLARRRWFVADATHLADLADGLARSGHRELAATAYTFAFTRSRGGGGWLSFGDDKHARWLARAQEQSIEVTLKVLADEVNRNLDGSSYVYGITQNLIRALAALGAVETSRLMWREAFDVINLRLPRQDRDAGVFADYEEAPNQLTKESFLVLLQFVRTSCPHRPTRVAALAGLSNLCRISPRVLSTAIGVFLSLNSSPTSVLGLIELLIEYEDRPYAISQSIAETLLRLARSNEFGVSEGARLLSLRAGQHVPPRHSTAGYPSSKISARKANAIWSLDSQEKIEIIKKLWNQFPMILAAYFDQKWNADKDFNLARCRNRNDLAHSRGSQSYPRADVLPWPKEFFEVAFQEVLNLRSFPFLGAETDPDIAAFLLRRILPGTENYITYWHSRSVRPPLPLPKETKSGSQPVVCLPKDDEYESWIRCGLYEEQLLLEGSETFPKCVGTTTMTGGATAGSASKRGRGSLPLGIAAITGWSKISADLMFPSTPELVGPLARFNFLRSYLGLCPILTLHPGCLVPELSLRSEQPCGWHLVDGSGSPTVRFRQWRVGPLGKDLDESAPRLSGCDLIVRPDFWEHIRRSAAHPIEFEVVTSTTNRKEDDE
jgi:AAA ATPase domain